MRLGFVNKTALWEFGPQANEVTIRRGVAEENDVRVSIVMNPPDVMEWVTNAITHAVEECAFLQRVNVDLNDLATAELLIERATEVFQKKYDKYREKQDAYLLGTKKDF